MKLKPLLATEVKDLNNLKLPMLLSVKLDGIYCLIIDGVAYSRSLKPIRNKHVQSLFGKPEYNGLIGELILGDIYSESCFRDTTSAVMSIDGEHDVKLYVFDDWSIGEQPFLERYAAYKKRVNDINNDSVIALKHEIVHTLDHLQNIVDAEQGKGSEGVILRLPTAKYRNGRATPKSQESVKIKYFAIDEYEVVGFTERMHNANEPELDELGYITRSNAKEGMIPMDTLGALILKYGDSTFQVGSGFNDAQRKEIWDNRDKYLGKLASVRHMTTGVHERPRLPTWRGFRDAEDMS